MLSRGCDPRDRAVPLRPRADRGRAMMTNTPPNGAFRGFGAPQTQFAHRSAHGSRSPRRSASIRCGCARSTRCGPATRPRPASDSADDCSALEVLREAVRRSDFRRKRAGATRAPRRGIGLSLFFHGSGFTGGGEVKLASRASLELTATGVRMLRRAPRSARARARCTRRSSPTRSAFRTSRSRSPQPTPASCPTADRRSPRAPAWWSAGSCSARAEEMRAQARPAHAGRVLPAARPARR